MLTRVDAKAVVRGTARVHRAAPLLPQPRGPRSARARSRSRCRRTPRCRGSRWRTNGQWMEAEVVEKQLARRAYDDFLHRRQDPALLEKAAGNQFTAKVFPIPANARQAHRDQLQPGAAGRALHAAAARPAEDRARRRRAAGHAAPTASTSSRRCSERNWQPDRDFVSTAATRPQVVSRRRSRRAARRGAGRRSATRRRRSEAPAGVTLLVDTSASRALGFARYVKRDARARRRLARALRRRSRSQVVAFDQDAEPMFYAASADEFARRAGRASCCERGAAGRLGPRPGARVDGAARAARARARRHRRRGHRGRRGRRARSAVKAARQRARSSASTSCSPAASATTRRRPPLVRAGLPRAGAVFDLDRDPMSRRRSARPCSTDVAIEVAGRDVGVPAHDPDARAPASA